jgi:hypothetical protein
MPVYSPEAVPVDGPGTPYVTPEILLSAATGIQWSTVGGPGNSRPTVEQQYAEQLNICKRASSMAAGYLNQAIHATIDTEQLTGPGDFRFQLQNGNQRVWLLLSRSPIISVLGGQYTPATAFPPQWTTIAANQFRVYQPVIGVYGTSSPGGSGDGGQVVVMAPGIVNWAFGRNAYDLQITYINGWPHGSLTAPAAAGATTISIDDCTGWAPTGTSTTGATGTIYDGGQQEIVTCTASSAVSGPGTLTLSRALSYAHGYGTMISTIPGSIQQAVILFAVSQALTRGATATTVQAVPGTSIGPGASAKQFVEAAREILHPYKRYV